MRFLRRMLILTCDAKNSNETALRKADSTRSLVDRLPKRQVNFFGQVMWREKLKQLVKTGMIEGIRSIEKVIILDGLTKWLKAGQVTDALKAMRDRDAEKVTIAYVKEQST